MEKKLTWEDFEKSGNINTYLSLKKNEENKNFNNEFGLEVLEKKVENNLIKG